MGAALDELRPTGWTPISATLTRRYYVADRAAKLAWRLQGEQDRITRIVLCACLPNPLSTPHYATRSGARVGMTFGEVQRIYGNKLERETKKGYQPYPVAFVRAGDREIVFAPESETTSLTNSTRVKLVTARVYSDYYMYDGC